MRRLLILGPGARGLMAANAAVPPALAAVEALEAAARARGIAVLRVAAVASGTPGLRQPPGAVFTGLPGEAGTAMIVPGYEPALGLNRSWYLAERLAELVRAGGFDGLALVHGAPVGLDILPLARRTAPALRIALVLAGAADAGAEATDPGSAPGAEARAVAARVLAEMARAADLAAALPGAAVPEGLDPARVHPAADAGALLDRMAG